MARECVHLLLITLISIIKSLITFVSDSIGREIIFMTALLRQEDLEERVISMIDLNPLLNQIRMIETSRRVRPSLKKIKTTKTKK